MKKEYEVVAGEINLRVGRELKNYKVGDLIIVDDQFAKNALVNQVKPTGRILEEEVTVKIEVPAVVTEESAEVDEDQGSADDEAEAPVEEVKTKKAKRTR